MWRNDRPVGPLVGSAPLYSVTGLTDWSHGALFLVLALLLAATLTLGL